MNKAELQDGSGHDRSQGFHRAAGAEYALYAAWILPFFFQLRLTGAAKGVVVIGYFKNRKMLMSLFYIFICKFRAFCLYVYIPRCLSVFHECIVHIMLIFTQFKT